VLIVFFSQLECFTATVDIGAMRIHLTNDRVYTSTVD